MIVDCAVYVDGKRASEHLALADAAEASRGEGAFVWIGLHEPTEAEFDDVSREFNLHELAVEDAIKAHQRPKLEVYDDTLFVVLRSATYVDASESVEFGEVMLFVGKDFVVTVRHGEMSPLSEARRRLEEAPELLECGPGAVLHAVVDKVVDDYAPVLRGLEVDIQQVEEEVFSEGEHNPAQRIYKLKREVLDFQRAVGPLVEPMELFARGRVGLVHAELTEYFRDVGDHVIRINEQVEHFRDLLTSVLEANLTQVSVRQNEDMRKISAWVAIAAVPTLLAGIYGMNFTYMPELDWRFGYPMALLLMAGICLGLWRAFRRSGWL